MCNSISVIINAFVSVLLKIMDFKMLHFEFFKSTFHSYKAGHLLFSKVACMYFHTLE